MVEDTRLQAIADPEMVRGPIRGSVNVVARMTEKRIQKDMADGRTQASAVCRLRTGRYMCLGVALGHGDNHRLPPTGLSLPGGAPSDL